MVMLAGSAVDHGFEPWSVQTKDYEIYICCFSAKHAAFRSNNNDSLFVTKILSTQNIHF
jgi:hypothetical protein